MIKMFYFDNSIVNIIVLKSNMIGMIIFCPILNMLDLGTASDNMCFSCLPCQSATMPHILHMTKVAADGVLNFIFASIVSEKDVPWKTAGVILRLVPLPNTS